MSGALTSRNGRPRELESRGWTTHLHTYAWRRGCLAFAVATMGLVDLLSALLSHPSDRLLALRRLVPTDVLDTSRTFTLLAGALLLVTAWGLRWGKRRAFVVALFLCAISVPVNLLKAFDFEEASVAAGLMFMLGISGDAFRVKSREISLPVLRSRAMWALLALALYAVGGAWVVKMLYGHAPSWRLAFADAGWRMFGIGDPVQMVPRSLPPAEARIITWYLKSLPVMILTLLIGLAIASLQPASYRRRHREEVSRVEALLKAHGQSSVGAFALSDADYFFSRNGRAVIAYRFESDTLLAIGDPIGPAEEIGPLLNDFANFCADADWQFAFFQARPESLPLYRERGWRALHIGEDPVLWTDSFTLEGAAVTDARRAARKADNAGIQTLHFVPERNPFQGAEHPELLDQMRTISSEWLRAHPGGEKGFCMGRFDPHRLDKEWLAIAVRPENRRVEGFMTWVPIWARHGWALDLMRRRLDSQPGTMEFLVARSAEDARMRGDAMLSLSLSALAQVEESTEKQQEPDPGREFLMEHLARFYDFKGLFRWKKKFAPSFEDRYLVYPHPLALPRVALALARAQSPGGLLSYFRRPHDLLTPPAAAATAPATTPSPRTT